MESVTLSGNDFKIIHNTLCELREVEMRLNTVLSADMVARLNRVVKGFEQGLRDAYDQDNTSFDRKCDYYNRFKQENGLKAVWSIFKLKEHGFLSDHPWEGAETVTYQGQTVPIQGPTWADLYRAADQVIELSGDQHHIFIEGFDPDVQHWQLRLTTGS